MKTKKVEKKLECKGGCEECYGGIFPIKVWGEGILRSKAQEYNYCIDAIIDDLRRGFTIEFKKGTDNAFTQYKNRIDAITK